MDSCSLVNLERVSDGLKDKDAFLIFKFLGWFKRVNFLLEFEVIDSLWAPLQYTLFFSMVSDLVRTLV